MPDARQPERVAGKTETRDESLRVALALSGGGTRAMFFHLGVLRYLAEAGLLETVRYISTVSGGTLLMGLVFRLNDYQWPTSEQFLQDIRPRLIELIAAKDLQRRALLRLALPWNWRYLPFRANVLAITIASAWEVAASVSRLPGSPIWAINATTVETGHRWRFRAEQEVRGLGSHGMGDREVGYTYDEKFPLAAAMATSAAFPGGISPLVIKTRNRTWYRPNFEDPKKSPQAMQPLFSSYHLADGGVYDNLGLEPVFDASKRQFRSDADCNYIVSSDAGAPLKTAWWGPISQFLGFTMRTVDIMSSQQRDLRVRSLVGAIVAKAIRGIFINIAEPARLAVTKAQTRGMPAAGGLQGHEWLSSEDATKAASYKTSLRSPNRQMRDLIERHGYEVAMAQVKLYGGDGLASKTAQHSR